VSMRKTVKRRSGEGVTGNLKNMTGRKKPEGRKRSSSSRWETKGKGVGISLGARPPRVRRGVWGERKPERKASARAEMGSSRYLVEREVQKKQGFVSRCRGGGGVRVQTKSSLDRSGKRKKPLLLGARVEVCGILEMQNKGYLCRGVQKGEGTVGKKSSKGKTQELLTNVGGKRSPLVAREKKNNNGGEEKAEGLVGKRTRKKEKEGRLKESAK